MATKLKLLEPPTMIKPHIRAKIRVAKVIVLRRMHKSPFIRLANLFASEADLARRFSVTPQAITKWKVRGIPEGRALDAEAISGGVVTAREVLEEARRLREESKTAA